MVKTRRGRYEATVGFGISEVRRKTAGQKNGLAGRTLPRDTAGRDQEAGHARASTHLCQHPAFSGSADNRSERISWTREPANHSVDLFSLVAQAENRIGLTAGGHGVPRKSWTP